MATKELVPAISVDTDAENTHRTQAVEILDAARGHRVKSPATYEAAAVILRDKIKPMIGRIEQFFARQIEDIVTNFQSVSNLQGQLAQQIVSQH